MWSHLPCGEDTEISLEMIARDLTNYGRSSGVHTGDRWSGTKGNNNRAQELGEWIMGQGRRPHHR